jgi:outer membrane protein
VISRRLQSSCFRSRLRRQVQSFALTLIVGGFCPSVHAEDLLQIYRLARANDPSFDGARFALEIVQQKIPQAKAALLPTVNLTGNDNSSTNKTAFTGTPVVDRGIHAWTWNLQLTQPLIRMENVFAYGESSFLVEQAQAQYDLAKNDLILRVVQAYFDVLVAQESVQVAEAQLTAAAEQMALAKRGFELGTNAITDVHEAKSRVDLARSQKIAGINELDTKRGDLEKIIGQAPGSLVPLNPAVVVPKPVPDNPKQWMEQARNGNPAVLAPKAALEAADFEIKKNRAEYLPTLDIVASYGQNYSSGNITIPTDYMTRSKTGQAGLQLTIPIFTSGLTSSHVAEAIARRNKAAADLELARRQAASDARQAYSTIESGLAQIEALESAVDSSRAAVKGNQTGYRLGIHVNIDVLNAERQLYTTERDLVKARYDTVFQGVKLKAAAGVLDESDVETVNGLLGHQ